MDTPITWIGGKRRLTKKLINLFPMHNVYVEVFGGSGAVLFAKPKIKVEVFNDLDSNLINFWKVIKEKPQEFIDSFKYTLISREVFNEYRDKYLRGDYKDSIERAHIFYYLVKLSFASDMTDPHFGVSLTRGALIKFDEIPKMINSLYDRLKEVTIENDSYENILNRYDRKSTFFFMDPPYRNTECYASFNFKDEDYINLRDMCSKLKGKFLITLNDDEFIRETFKNFNILDNKVLYSAAKDSSNYFDEVVITNYKLF